MATSPSNAIESLVAISILALVHLFVKELGRIRSTVRYALLSAGAGASLAYVLLRILPKLAEKQEDLMASVGTGVRGFLEHHAYLVAMVGVVAYFGLSRAADYGAQRASSDSRDRYPAWSPSGCGSIAARTAPCWLRCGFSWSAACGPSRRDPI